MAEDLEAIMSLMNDKFDQSFADEQPSKQRRSQNPPDLPSQQQKAKQQQLKHSIKQVNVQDQQIFQQEHHQVIKGENRQTFGVQNLKKQVSISLPQCQFQLALPQKEIKQAIIAQNHAKKEDEQEDQEHQSQKDAKPLILQMQTDENDDLLSYQSLTQKFDAAFSKLKHNQSVNSSQSQFTQRQQHYRRKKATDINLLRAQKQKQVARLCTAKPLINSRSEKLLFNHKPIHIRYQAVIEEKKKKIETQVAQKVAKQTLEEEMQLNQIKKHQQQIKRKLGNQIRTQQVYYNEMRNWAQNKKKKIEDLAQKKTEQSQKEITFKPEISQKSQLIMKKYAVRVPIYEKTPVPKKASVDNNCTFKPNLNKTLKK